MPTPLFEDSSRYQGPEIHDSDYLSERLLQMGHSVEETIRARRLAQAAIGGGFLASDMINIERVPRRPDGNHENNAEHSWMLEVVAIEIADILELGVDIEKVRAFSTYHDLLEIKGGDVATFGLTQDQLKEKDTREKALLEELTLELPEGAAKNLDEYMKQDTKEALFVRMVDKLMPTTVNIVNNDLSSLIEDFGVENLDGLIAKHNDMNNDYSRRFGHYFPDLVIAHGVLCTILEDIYAHNSDAKRTGEIVKAPKETELKFLIDLNALPKEIDLLNPDIQREHFVQGYLEINDDGSEIRIRSIDDAVFELTTKSAGTIEREEITKKIKPETFHRLLHSIEGQVIEKTRYYIPSRNGAIIELDIYHGNLNGLVTAEIEFKGRDALKRAVEWVPPTWFGRNVTDSSRHKNHNLALHGTPNDEEGN